MLSAMDCLQQFSKLPELLEPYLCCRKRKHLFRCGLNTLPFARSEKLLRIRLSNLGKSFKLQQRMTEAQNSVICSCQMQAVSKFQH